VDIEWPTTGVLFDGNGPTENDSDCDRGGLEPTSSIDAVIGTC
jgi:hypothetical protein